MSTKKVSDVQPDVKLRRWRIMEVETKIGTRTRHVWGHDVNKDIGLATSEIVEFDLHFMIATTRSGSKYRLVGLPGASLLGKSAWTQWCNNNGVVSESDVTNEYLDVGELSTGGFAKVIRTVL
jgi:hypothetical protein